MKEFLGVYIRFEILNFPSCIHHFSDEDSMRTTIRVLGGVFNIRPTERLNDPIRDRV